MSEAVAGVDGPDAVDGDGDDPLARSWYDERLREHGAELPGYVAQAVGVSGHLLAGASLAALWRWRWRGAVVPALAVAVAPRHLLRRPPRTGGGARLRLVSWNVLVENDSAHIAPGVRAAGGDVTALFELTEPALRGLERRGLPAAVSCTGEAALGRWRPDYFGLAVLARPGLAVTSAVHHVESSALVRAELPIAGADGRPAVLFALRPTAPICAWRLASWRAYWAGIDDLLTAEGPDRALVLCGDLNTTIWHRPLRDLTRRHDLGSARAGRLGGTWHHHLLGWRATLDHVLVRGLGVRSASLGGTYGSDHKPLVVELDGWPLAAPPSR